MTSCTVQFIGQTQETSTVKASASGEAEFGVTLDSPFGDEVIVSSTSADGWVSEKSSWGSRSTPA